MNKGHSNVGAGSILADLYVEHRRMLACLMNPIIKTIGCYNLCGTAFWPTGGSWLEIDLMKGLIHVWAAEIR